MPAAWAGALEKRHTDWSGRQTEMEKQTSALGSSGISGYDVIFFCPGLEGETRLSSSLNTERKEFKVVLLFHPEHTTWTYLATAVLFEGLRAIWQMYDIK